MDKPLPPEQRRVLGIGKAQTVRYRRVRLVCGSVVLSEADNCYVPARLTTEINERLDTTDIPFFKVVQGLHFQRRTPPPAGLRPSFFRKRSWKTAPC